jgi:hypothetical protein
MDAVMGIREIGKMGKIGEMGEMGEMGKLTQKSTLPIAYCLFPIPYSLTNDKGQMTTL